MQQKFKDTIYRVAIRDKSYWTEVEKHGGLEKYQPVSYYNRV